MGPKLCASEGVTRDVTVKIWLGPSKKLWNLELSEV